MFTINIQSNIREFERRISNVAYQQLPFATAQALTALAQAAADEEKRNEAKTLDRPRPFTTGAIRVRRASKSSQEAVVWMMDATARYLAPYEFGGPNVLNQASRAVLKPVAAMADLDQYGNLPRSFTRTLKGRSDIFVGTVQTKNGPVDGIWQRTSGEGVKVTHTRVTKKGRVVVRKVSGLAPGVAARKLRLVVKFENPHPVRQNLDWFGVAQRTVAANFKQEMGRALARAIATARK